MPLVISIVSQERFIIETRVLREFFDKTHDAQSSTIRVMNSIVSATEEGEESDQYIIGVDDDGIAALMIISGGMSMKIDELVAKPGNGSRMVEFAMNLCKGRATLDSFDQDSTNFWGKVGFVKFAELPMQKAQGGCKMRLDCSQSPKWENTDAGWRIKRAAAVPIGFGPREPQPYRGLGVGRKEAVWQ